MPRSAPAIPRLLAAAWLGLTAPALAQEAKFDDPAQKQAYDAAFQAMLRDPGNGEKTLKYAEAAIKAGNFEGAISALERLLLFNPSLPRVKLELGTLYYRLGSYDMARTYLQEVADTEAAPMDMRDRARTFLDEIASRSSPHQFSGSLSFGLRWQSNANSGPSSRSVLALGAPALIDERFTEQNDVNGFVSGRIVHSYDPGSQSGLRLETTGTVYLTRHADQKQLDLGFFEVTTGPRVPVAVEGTAKTTFRPFLLANVIRVDDDRDFLTKGFGVEADSQIDARWRVDGGVSYLSRDYNTDQGQARRNRDGHDWVVRLGTSYGLDARSAVAASAEMADRNARVARESFREYRLSARYSLQYGAPVDLTFGSDSSAPWTSSFAVDRIWSDRDGQDQMIDPFRARQDDQWRFGVTTTAPLADDWALVGSVQRTIADSNLPNYDHDNWSVSLGAAWRF